MMSENRRKAREKIRILGLKILGKDNLILFRPDIIVSFNDKGKNNNCNSHRKPENA
jgi:hypothetical protein